MPRWFMTTMPEAPESHRSTIKRQISFLCGCCTHIFSHWYRGNRGKRARVNEVWVLHEYIRGTRNSSTFICSRVPDRCGHLCVRRNNLTGKRERERAGGRARPNRIWYATVGHISIKHSFLTSLLSVINGAWKDAQCNILIVRILEYYCRFRMRDRIH